MIAIMIQNEKKFAYLNNNESYIIRLVLLFLLLPAATLPWWQLLGWLTTSPWL